MKNLATIAFLLISFTAFAQVTLSVGVFSHETDMEKANKDIFWGNSVRVQSEIHLTKTLFVQPAFAYENKVERATYSGGIRPSFLIGAVSETEQGERLFIGAGLFAYSPMGKSGSFRKESFSGGVKLNGGFELFHKLSIGLTSNFSLSKHKERLTEFYLAFRI